MKKTLLIGALAALAIFGTTVYLHAESSTPSLKDEGTLHLGFRCEFCKGTGFSNGTGSTNCNFCKGTGRNSSY